MIENTCPSFETAALYSSLGVINWDAVVVATASLHNCAPLHTDAFWETSSCWWHKYLIIIKSTGLGCMSYWIQLSTLTVVLQWDPRQICRRMWLVGNQQNSQVNSKYIPLIKLWMAARRMHFERIVALTHGHRKDLGGRLTWNPFT